MVKKSISIKNIFIVVFVVLMLTTVGVISYIVFSKWLSSADETTTKIAEDMNTEIYLQIDTLIHIPDHINEVNQKLIENNIVNFNNELMREKFFVGVLQSHPDDIYSFSFGSETGEYYGARRNANGDIEIMRNNANTDWHSWYYSVTDDMTAGELVLQAGNFDARTREWYKAAKETGRPVFSPIYKHFIMDDLTVSAAYPIYNNEGELQGVLGTHMILSKIDSFLKDIVKDKNGFAVIIEKKSGELIANSLKVNNYITLNDDTIKRVKFDEVENQTLISAFEHYKGTGESSFKIKSDRNIHYLKMKEYSKEGLDWIVITAIHGNELKAGITESIKLAFLLVVLASILSMLIYYMLTNKLVKPIYSLIEATEKLSQGDLTQRVAILRNDEIGKISKSFNKMADTLYMLVNNLEETVKDRTAELEKTNYELKENKDQLQLILDSTAEAIYGVDKEGNCTFCNAKCIELLGYTNQDELFGKNMHFQIHHSRKDGTINSIEECKIIKSFMAGKAIHADDEVFWRTDGTCFDVEYNSYPQYKDGQIVGAVVTFIDNTKRKKTEEEIKYLSCHDFLTGLFNRRYFEDALKNIDIEENLPISIIFGDLNGLKLTNDVFGHVFGDALIKKSAEVLKNVCREGDIVARVGGDEFIILLPKTEESDANKIIARVKYELSKEQIAAIRCCMSLGCDTKTSSDQEIERLMANAENKMYKDKTLNRKTNNTDMINTLISTLHEKSPREKQHSIKISELCRNIGQALKLPKTEVKKLEEIGFLHDVGKIVLDSTILNNKGELLEEEKKAMEQHTVIGYRILNLFDDTVDIAEGVFSHHENWDGSGYPKGLIGEEIPRLSRILAVAEYYDSLTNKFYKKVVSKEEAMQEIRKLSGLKFDPEIVDIFLGII